MPILKDIWPNVQGLDVLVVSFICRRRDLEVPVFFIWRLEDGNFCGVMSVGSSVERLKPPRLSIEAATAALIREGYADSLENCSAEIRPQRSIGELQYTYRHKAFPPVG